MSAILGVVAAVPANRVPTEDEKFALATGIKERRIKSEGQDTGVLGTIAAGRVLGAVGWAPETVGAIVCVTQTPPVRMPATACIIAGNLGIPAPAFDINLACSGYVYGLWVASHLPFQRVLLVAGDCVSEMVNPADPGSANLFGDAVTATAVDNSGHYPSITFALGTDGKGWQHLVADYLIRMDGSEVFNFAAKCVPDLVHRVVPPEGADTYLFHQANGMMLRHIGRKLGLTEVKMPMNIQRYGNTSSASIPLLLCDSAITESVKHGTLSVGMFGFGAGWSLAGAYMKLGPLKVAEVVEV